MSVFDFCVSEDFKGFWDLEVFVFLGCFGGFWKLLEVFGFWALGSGGFWEFGGVCVFWRFWEVFGL